jgi:hypothetical protein
MGLAGALESDSGSAVAAIWPTSAVVAQHVERANVGVHVLGDQLDDLVEAVLRSQGLRHGFAQLPKQDARTADRCDHLPLTAPLAASLRA